MSKKIELKTTSSGLPFVTVDNFFTEYETGLLLKELDFIRPHLDGFGSSGAATHPDGSLMKRNHSLFLNSFFAAPEYSSIFKFTRYFYEKEFLTELRSKHWLFNCVEHLPCVDNIQVLYYEQSNSYEEHRDVAFLTYLYWVHKEPKKFDGGNLVLEKDTTVEMKSNRLLIMPSITPHAVTPVRMQEEAPGFGRYCISNFVHLNTLVPPPNM